MVKKKKIVEVREYGFLGKILRSPYFWMVIFFLFFGIIYSILTGDDETPTVDIRTQGKPQTLTIQEQKTPAQNTNNTTQLPFGNAENIISIITITFIITAALSVISTIFKFGRDS